MSQNVKEEKQSTTKESRKLSKATPIDYEGKHYDSMALFCRENNLKAYLFRRKYNGGFSIQDAIKQSKYTQEELERIEKDKNNKKHYKYNGKTYGSKGDALKAAGLSRRVSQFWQNLGIEITEDNIAYHIRRYKSTRKKDIICKIEYRGNTYYSIRSLLTAYNKVSIIYSKSWNNSDKSIRTLLNLLEESLRRDERKTWNNHGEEVIFEGKMYGSFKQLCKAFNKDRNTIKNRLNHGMSLKDALTMDEVHTIRDINVFNSIVNSKKDLNRIFGISMHILYKCDTDEKMQLQLEKKLVRDGIVENKVGNMYICKCPKCNRSVYVPENRMIEFIRHNTDDLCKQYELQEAS